MKKNALRGCTVLAILLAVFCVIAFAVPFARTKGFWLGFGFGLFAILFQLYIFRSADTVNGSAKSRFYGFPVARIGVVYLAAQLAVSLAEMALAKVLPAWAALTVNILLAALAVVGCITVTAMRDEILEQDGRLRKNVANMRELQSLSAALAGQCADEELRPALQKLADEFRYSDPVSSEQTQGLEEDMRSRLGDIEQALMDGDADGVKRLCARLTAALAERNRVCSVNK